MQYEDRPYQQEAIREGVAAFTERGHNSVLLESPVGSGKTYMALAEGTGDYIKSISLGGKKAGYRVSHEDLIKAGGIKFTLSDRH